MQDLTEKLQEGKELDTDDIRLATEAILDGSVDHESKADFLDSLSSKGETAAEIAGFASEFLARAVEPGLDKEAIEKPLIDVCGTGGDKLNLFNVSTTSVFLLAACDVAVVKHGNRGITSKSGGADVLEALGIRIDLPPEDFGRCVDEVGAGFLFAPLYHPAFKAVVPVRQLLAQRGKRTIFNLLGPLLNPVCPDYQLIGVFDRNVGSIFADILARLGRRNAWAVHGSAGESGGMDELSTLGETEIWTTSQESMTVNPSDLGISAPGIADLQGGEADENAEILEGILSSKLRGPKRDLAALNSAAGLTICGKARNLSEGLALVSEAIDSGQALEVLHKWQSFA